MIGLVAVFLLADCWVTPFVLDRVVRRRERMLLSVPHRLNKEHKMFANLTPAAKRALIAIAAGTRCAATLRYSIHAQLADAGFISGTRGREDITDEGRAAVAAL